MVKKVAPLKLVDGLDEKSLPHVIVNNFVDGKKKKYTLSQIEEEYKI